MSRQSAQASVEVMRSYTKGLKVPTMIGVFVDGTRIPGGPYTAAQGICGAVVLVAGYFLHGFWGAWLQTVWPHFQLLDWPLLLIAAGAVTKAAGHVPETTRNPLLILTDGGRATLAPRYGTRYGKPLRPGGQTKVTGRVLTPNATTAIDLPTQHPKQASPQTPVSSPPFPTAGAAPVSHVAQLLAREPHR